MHDIPIVRGSDHQAYAVLLPCSQDEFREFVSGILSKGQTIEGWVRGTFEIGKSDLVNIYHLVEQRVAQQNEASLVEFTATVYYDDNSSIRLGSLHDFESYTEIRPHISHGINLTWVYLIRFQGKTVPEKQEISVTFNTIRLSRYGYTVEPLVFEPQTCGRFSVQIRHTVRSWGVDLESLLIGHLKTLEIQRTRFRRFLMENSARVGWASFFALLAATLAGIYETMAAFSQARLQEFATKYSQISEHAETEKVRVLGEAVLSGREARFTLALVIFILLALIVSAAFGVFLSEQSSKVRPSFLLLTKEAEAARNQSKLKEARFNTFFWGTLVGGVLSGLIGNYIFLQIFSN